jgi:hypothetical protein
MISLVVFRSSFIRTASIRLSVVFRLSYSLYSRSSMITMNSLSFRRFVAWFRCIWAVTTGGAASVIWLYDLAPCI